MLVAHVITVAVACSATTRTSVLRVFLDGVPDPGADEAVKVEVRGRVAPAPGQPEADRLELASDPGLPSAALVLPPSPFEALRTWDEVLRALPLDSGGGVDWVAAFNQRLVTPKLLRTAAPLERPLTLDNLLEGVVEDPRLPALNLDITMVPTERPFYEVKFPHNSHTSWLGCSSCHPGILREKTDMKGILKGQYCGRCHGKVSFEPEYSCGRCHVNLRFPEREAVVADLTLASARPVAASEQVVARGAALYSELCSVCHGEKGNGAGPMAAELNPKPRDFTAGKYKFRTTLPMSIPTDLDILRTITRGVPGTSMPTWSKLPLDDRWALVHYVKTFSENFQTSEPQVVEASVPPEITPELLVAGQDMYKQAGCEACHGAEGRGDGPSAPTLKDDWGNPLLPYGFTSGRPMKGGEGIEYVYNTVMTGLQGTPMPGFGGALQPDQGWALSAYVYDFYGKEPLPFAVKGDIPFVRSEELQNDPEISLITPVVFPHYFHRIRFKCASCHPNVFKMEAGANNITMFGMRDGTFCATCHGGGEAFEIGFPTCVRCHVAGT